MAAVKPSIRKRLVGLRCLLGACGVQAQAQTPVKIGLIVPLSGPWARQGQVMRIGAEMAHINAAGGKPIVEGTSLADNGLSLVVDETFTPPPSTAAPLVQRVRASHPELFLLLPTAELLVVQWQDGELKTVYPTAAAVAAPIWPTR